MLSKELHESGAVRVGAPAPGFLLTAQNGKPVSLADFRGKWVVLYFYPRDETPGCVAESCAFRDAYEDFTAAGAEVIGVSDDSVDSHQKFAANRRLPFLLLSDPGGGVRHIYGVKRLFGVSKQRMTFVIDPDGVVRYIFSSQVEPKGHVTRTLEFIRSQRK
ncbi:MAG: putative peroxiredoxin bcp [Myxococcota bacterium]|nr:putative peroxiredoxin bcp [Myxococcota bacterium]